MQQAGYNKMMTTSQTARADLQWWCNNLIEWNGQEIQDQISDLETEMDAS